MGNSDGIGERDGEGKEGKHHPYTIHTSKPKRRYKKKVIKIRPKDSLRISVNHLSRVGVYKHMKMTPSAGLQ